MSTPPPSGRLRAAAVVLALAAAGAAWACGGDGAPGATPGRPAFDGQRALEHVRLQVAFGPRVPGTDGHAGQLAWMLRRLDSLDADVVADTFDQVTTGGDSLVLVNVTARFRPELDRRIALFAHWDTRPFADQDPDSANHLLPIPGANDGGSGVAVLMELAELMAADSPPVGVDLVFLDGEDYGPGTDDMFLGAERYAERLPAAGRPVYGVLLDMVGDASPLFLQEGYSMNYALPVVRKVWGVAHRLGYDAMFPERAGGAIGDDHLALNQAGLPTIDVIDLDYGPDNAFWHTLADDVGNVHASTLEAVGEVMAELIYAGG